MSFATIGAAWVGHTLLTEFPLTRGFTPSLALCLVFIVVGLFLPARAVLGHMLIAIVLLTPRRRGRSAQTQD